MIEQRLRNRFPLWAKLRNDPSAFGARLFSVFGEYFDYTYAENRRVLDDQHLLKRGLGIGYFYQVPLDEDDQMVDTVSSSGEQIWTYPTSVVGTTDSVEYDLTRVDSIEELAWSPPSRVSLVGQYGANEVVIYSDDRQGNVTLAEIDYPAHLVLWVYGSTNYFKKTSSRNTRASGEHLIIVSGKDANGIAIQEYFRFNDDGYYQLKNVWSEITEVIPEGFDGQIALTMGYPTTWITDPFKPCITEELEGPLKLILSGEDNIKGLQTYITYWTDTEPKGENYRDGIVEIEPNVEEKWQQYLLDSDGVDYTGVGIAIHPNSTRLYCVDDTGRVHVYEPSPSVFGPPTNESTLTAISYIDAIPVKPYARTGEEVTIFTRWVRIRFPIKKVSIKRISPTETIEFLQADKTWAGSEYFFLGTLVTTGLVEDSWTDFAFTSSMDEAGQWEFYITVVTDYDTTVSYTAVMVDELTALVSLETGVTDVVYVWFSPNDELVITSLTPGPDGEQYSFYVFTEHSDIYLADTQNQTLYLRENYDSIEVTV